MGEKRYAHSVFWIWLVRLLSKGKYKSYPDRVKRNLWLDQMHRRCPQSPYEGVGRLPGYRWIIESRGYANIVSDQGAVVYGLIYDLVGEDEKNLDKNEGVPDNYTKEIMKIDFWSSKDGAKVDVTQPPEKRDALVYIDRVRLKESSPKDEYVYRMNQGINDALGKGIPRDYVQKYLRRFIPAEHNEAAVKLALQQAQEFKES